MKKIVTGILLGLLATTAAGREINQTLDAHPDGEVSVSNVAGEVIVEGWDKDQVELTGDIGDDVDEVIFDRDGRDIRIKIKADGKGWGRQDTSADLYIKVPRRSELDIGTVSADIEIEGVEGELDLQSVSGDIVAEAYMKDIDAGTVSGDIEIVSKKGDSLAQWDFESVSGDIHVEGLSGEIDAEVVSGDLEIKGVRFTRARAETVNGDIGFYAALHADGRLDIETVNGSVDVEFTEPVSARFDIETFNGRIRNCFGPKPERTSKYAPGLELSFREGAGDARVSISTLNGSLSLCHR